MWCERAQANVGVNIEAWVIDSGNSVLDFGQLEGDIRHFNTGENIGHLNRNGKDGWGRAFCHGLALAISGEYDYALHVECDSVLLRPMQPMLDWMEQNKVMFASGPMSSQPRDQRLPWLETGLMAFDVKWADQQQVLERYGWGNISPQYPSPEQVIRQIAGKDYREWSWRTMRDDYKVLTADNVGSYNLDWLSHAPMDVMEKFYEGRDEIESRLWY
jgi:hypothetical protein